jgi:L-lactate permease
MDFLLAILPIAVLIHVMTKKRSWPSHISLPFAAALVYFLTLVHFRLDPNLVNAIWLGPPLAHQRPAVHAFANKPFQQTHLLLFVFTGN